MFQDKFICFLFLCVNLSQGTIWNFGEDRRSSKIIAHHIGYISATVKTKRIPITVSECMKLVNVKVDVDNVNTVVPPAVSFNKDSNVIIINYDHTQDSRSTYDIVARGIKNTYCRNGKVRRRKKHFWKP